MIATTSTGDPFTSEPSEVSATFQGQTWVWGVDPYVTSLAGWVGSTWLTRDSCTSSACYYTIKTPASSTNGCYPAAPLAPEQILPTADRAKAEPITVAASLLTMVGVLAAATARSGTN